MVLFAGSLSLFEREPWAFVFFLEPVKSYFPGQFIICIHSCIVGFTLTENKLLFVCFIFFKKKKPDRKYTVKRNSYYSPGNEN